MARLAEDNTFTQIVRFDVAPDKQLGLIEAISSEVERWICKKPGFASSTFHASFDGNHVLNYAQWGNCQVKTTIGFDGVRGEMALEISQQFQRAGSLARPRFVENPSSSTNCGVNLTAPRG